VLAFRELDDALGRRCSNERTSKDGSRALGDVAAGRLAAYEVLNEAPQLHDDPATSRVKGGQLPMCGVGEADGRFETRRLRADEQLLALADLSRQ
jgi:hypothetical protein